MPISYSGPSDSNGFGFKIVTKQPFGNPDFVSRFILNCDDQLPILTDIRNQRFNCDTYLFWIPQKSVWLGFDLYNQHLDGALNNVPEEVGSPYFWKTDYVPTIDQITSSKDGVVAIVSRYNPKVTCPKCGGNTECYHYDASPSADANEDGFVLGCNSCGHQETVILPGGSASQVEWHNLCPFCFKSSNGHRPAKFDKSCPKCGSYNYYTCKYVGDTGHGSESVDTYLHTCKNCSTEISSPSRTVSQAGEQDQDNYCPCCGKITRSFS